MRFRRAAQLFISLALLATTLLAAEPPRVTAEKLPSWFPLDPVLHADKGWVHAFDYDEETFTVAKPGHPDDTEKVTVRGRYWAANLSPNDAYKKLWKQQAFEKWKPLAAKLTAEGFREVWHKQTEYVLKETFRKGEGQNATYVYVQIEVGGANWMRAVEIASNPLVIDARPPAAVPEKVGPKDSFPFLPPAGHATVKQTSHYDKPMTFEEEPKCEYTPVGTGAISKWYDADASISNIEFALAYADALRKAGWVVSCNIDKQGRLFAHYDKNGRNIYAFLGHSDHEDHYIVADVGSELKSALAQNCKAAVYGINFDFDKATLRPDSDATLDQVLKLLKEEPKLTVEIGGHTDNVGKPDYNLTLSERRAAAVKEWLVAHGIAAARLTSHGYGDTQPLVKNDSDENRAKNRRVELKKPGCK